jgi:hypothetical protein
MKGEKLMRSVKTFLIALLLTLLVSSGYYQEAMAKKSTITLVNKTNEKVTFYFSGDKSYEFTVKPGAKVSEEIDHDTYLVSYTVCKTDFSWKLKFKGDEKIVLYPCNHQPTKMQVKSHLADDVELIIDGYDDYEIDIEPGKNKVELFSGDIYYEYEACDGQLFSGEIYVAKSGTTQLILHSCEWFAHPARIYGQPNPVNFKIVNHASFPIILTLIGPESYLVTANPGVNIFTLVSGSYKYSYYQDYKVISGSMVVTKNGVGVLVITPVYVYDYVDDTDDLE